MENKKNNTDDGTFDHIEAILYSLPPGGSILVAVLLIGLFGRTGAIVSVVLALLYMIPEYVSRMKTLDEHRRRNK